MKLKRGEKQKQANGKINCLGLLSYSSLYYYSQDDGKKNENV